jgi:hypothetical protein
VRELSASTRTASEAARRSVAKSLRSSSRSCSSQAAYQFCVSVRANAVFSVATDALLTALPAATVAAEVFEALE